MSCESEARARGNGIPDLVGPCATPPTKEDWVKTFKTAYEATK